MEPSFTVYDVTMPVFIRSLGTLRTLVEKAHAHAGSDTDELLNARLAPDMYNFIQQVQYAYFMALETAVNLTGRPMPTEFKYDEKTESDLDNNLARAMNFLRSIGPDEMETDLEKEVKTFLDEEKTRPLRTYILTLALPNFFFHLTTAYDILRHKGVPLRKEDYLGI